MLFRSTEGNFYYRFDIREWKQLNRPIEAKETGFVRDFTNLFLLEHSVQTPELWLRTEEEYRLCSALKRAVWGDSINEPDKNNPGFMQTPEWGYKNLNTALASWAELKHDAILYGEQPMAAECGGAGPPDPIVVGYVEPNLPFWRKMENILQATRLILQQNDCMTDDLKGKTDQLNDYVTFLIQVTEKELRGEKLTEPEYRTLEYMGSSIEYFTLSVVDPDLHLDDWSLVQGPDKSIAIVADIYTRNIRGCNKNGILHIATGNANNIYVVVEIEGNLYLTRGATFSYYEFVQPLGTRLTDEEWQKMLEEKKAPAVPEWMKSILIEKEPHVNERVFYSSGC